eukprot:15134-Heterococcus_DN1.PRE.1
MSAPVPTYVPYAGGKFTRKFDAKGKAKNGLQNLIMRITDKSSVPVNMCSCAADAIELGSDAAVLEAIIQKHLWRSVVQRAGALAESHKPGDKKSLILSTTSTVAVTVTAQAAAAWRLGIGLAKRDALVQRLHTAPHRVEPHIIDNPDKHAVWNILLDEIQREPGTVFIDELFVNLQVQEGADKCARDQRKPVRCAAVMPTHAAAVHTAQSPYVIACSSYWHTKTLWGDPGTLELKAHWFHAMQRGDIALVESLWAYKPQELKNVRFAAHHDDDSITPLQFAVTLGNAPLLQALFSLRRVNKQGQSVAAFRACLQHGANPVIPSDKSCFPHHLCAMRACDPGNNRDMNRRDAFMAIARVLLKGCNDERLQSHPEAVVLDDWLELREYKYYTDAAKAFLQQALQLNAQEAAAAVAIAPVATAGAAVTPAAAAVAA